MEDSQNRESQSQNDGDDGPRAFEILEKGFGVETNMDDPRDDEDYAHHFVEGPDSIYANVK